MSYMKNLVMDILELHELGATVQEIAKSLDIEVKMVKDTLKTWGDDFK